MCCSRLSRQYLIDSHSRQWLIFSGARHRGAVAQRRRRSDAQRVLASGIGSALCTHIRLGIVSVRSHESLHHLHYRISLLSSHPCMFSLQLVLKSVCFLISFVSRPPIPSFSIHPRPPHPLSSNSTRSPAKRSSSPPTCAPRCSPSRPIRPSVAPSPVSCPRPPSPAAATRRKRR
jgi:hypothetical protein